MYPASLVASLGSAVSTLSSSPVRTTATSSAEGLVAGTDRFWDGATVTVVPEDLRPGGWAGGPSALLVDGVWWLAYRLRRPVGEGRGYANVVARSTDGVTFEQVVRIDRDDFGA